ncbi:MULTISPECIES: response regulator transcription factor [Vagococcus]|uniref:Phosphate regulon transcriptional regulatory protein PhoB (SphR) n=1 Tax=Vagococcus fluvialis bH819 TaxID=1255619 RepID=A0A1X6WPG2_9ENTE|nr:MULTISPECIES: response regulator transcription factor [Vagococcus]SLM86169.1 Phosphate regulon transcriptional regulatory protein PhoB (SphR) [Vagococcus fluvialis bH819]HCM90417.1 DNA-binding response regulator [Vagococcus sp.]
MKILLAEDDKQMQKILKIYLENEGYEVRVASNGEEGLGFVTEEEFDLVILDWMMPKMDGVTLCREIRQMNLPVKIIMLTAKNSSTDELRGLVAGADDYISKPFDIAVLLVRIKKMIKSEKILAFDQLTLNPETHEVKVTSDLISLTKKEYNLLYYFMQNKNIILSREQLLANVWGMNYEGDIRTVDTHVKRLRQKIGNHYIATKVGIGYLMGEK